VAYGTDYNVVGQEDRKIALDILGGEHPADIPVQTVPATELCLNLRAAKRFGVTIPQELLDKATKKLSESTLKR
jgi:putative ABC transport system substrate-binding protein